MSIKDTLINQIIEVEGGYVNNPHDSGGETNYGITAAVARSNGYEGDMRDLPITLAYNIYARTYWDAVKGDQLLSLSEMIAHEVVDTAVNMGAKRAAVFLQRALNALNDRGQLYSELDVDGFIGSATLEALSSYLAHRDERILSRALNCLQGAFYIELAEQREKDKTFVYGWLNKRIAL